ncbi:hypothetical protein PV328_012345, partial [Microctonus aethiopoides]
MVRKNQKESGTAEKDEEMVNPPPTVDMVNPSPMVDEPNSGTIPIDEREQIRRNSTKFARELDPYDIVALLDLRGLNSKGSMDVLVDRLVRYELCRNFGEDAADWDPREDDRDGVPRTRVGWQGELSMDEALLEVRSNRNNSLNARSNDSIQEQNRQRQKITPSAAGTNRIVDQMLPTGQSMGPYKDPMSFTQNEADLSIYYVPPPSGTSQTVTNPSGTTQYNQPPSGTTQYNLPPSGTTQYNLPPSGTTQYNQPPSGTTQYNLSPSGTTQYNQPPSGTTQYNQPPSGKDYHFPILNNHPTVQRDRNPTVNFADNYDRSSSPVLNQYRASSTRLLDRREQPVPQEQSPIEQPMQT